MYRFNSYIICLLLILGGYINSTFAQEPPFLIFQDDEWVKSTFNKLSAEEKIGQLIMIAAYPDQGEIHKKQIIEIINKYKPGGVLIMQGSPYKTAIFINEIQEASDIPLIIATDGETGLGFRIDSTISYPRAQALGAINNSGILYQLGADIGEQFKTLGIHINFAPVADVNTNPENPVISFRSFGENKINVSEKTIPVVQGMQDAGILAVAKHFPGHGDTQTDSHYDLPVLNKSKQMIDSVEAYPFKQLIDEGIGGIMTAHLHVPDFDKIKTPASLSPDIIQSYLKDELGFKGLIFTDAMNMGGVVLPSGQAELEALKAGNDMVEFVPDIAAAIQTIKTALQEGEISIEEMNSKCKKVLALKRWAGLNNYEPSALKNLIEVLNKPSYEVKLRKLVENSLTVLANDHVLPLNRLDTLRIAVIKIGGDTISAFQEMLGNYTKTENFYVSKNVSLEELEKLKTNLQAYNLIISGIHGINMFPANQYGITKAQQDAFNLLLENKKSVFVFFGNAYALKYFKNIEKAEGLVLAYEDSKLTQELSAQLIFGAVSASGRLPVTINKYFKEGQGIPVEKNGRFKYTIPEEVAINSELLNYKIDSIANLGLDSAAYPGCQVLIALDGKIIFHKCYGYLTYDKLIPVRKDHIYDWASVTKITGPLPALMKLNSAGKFDLDLPLSKYWPDFIGSNKENISIRDILAHQGRMQAWIAYWQSALRKNGKLRTRIFKKNPNDKYTFRISSELYMNSQYQKTMFDQIRDSELLDKKEYVYSGLSFYLFPTIIQNLTQTDYETYLKKNFYRPLGAYTITYNPYKYFPIENMVPTEYDDYFRHELIQGFVHDEGAAMMNGVSGNAGLFGTANDLAKLMQMYLQKGEYAGKRYIPEKTVNEFIRCQFPENDNRRSLGFDKPYIDNYKNDLKDAYPAVDASPNSFGHSGFTGTFTWADPDNKLLFIFFSNRVHPTRENQKLYDLNIRPAMHQVIYDCIKEEL
ncbi:MAG: serine hydrolase [Prolixibacteraceae bacterium]|nr:serine hydrolase [Prolixibacteraceae bacterium]MBN2775231.1 serine hydrolase [Prolixibacteraceae bacterium]